MADKQVVGCGEPLAGKPMWYVKGSKPTATQREFPLYRSGGDEGYRCGSSLGSYLRICERCCQKQGLIW